MDKARFKIDFIPRRHYNIGLFHRVRKLFGFVWNEIESFDSILRAREHYEKIKDLPEYLP